MQKIAMRHASRILTMPFVKQVGVCFCKGRDLVTTLSRGNRLMCTTCCCGDVYSGGGLDRYIHHTFDIECNGGTLS